MMFQKVRDFRIQRLKSPWDLSGVEILRRGF